MVEIKEIVTLFKIEKLDEETERLIPYKVIDGRFDEDTFIFEGTDGTLYQHIEETSEYNCGYANLFTVEYHTDFEDLESVKQQRLEEDLKYKYIRFISDRSTIYQKSYEDGKTEEMIDPFSRKSQQKEQEENNKIKNLRIEQTPKEILEKVKETIKGQDDAIKTIVTCLWATYNHRDLSKKQMLLIGPTGVGKTAIFKKIQKLLDIPITIFSVPGLSQAGYIGRSTDEILKQVYLENEENIELAEKSIVILDEFDKLAYNGNDKDGAVSTVGVQNELLKIIEGCTRIVELDNDLGSFVIDTSNMLFIATGAFQELYEEKPNQKVTIGFNSATSIQNKKKEINPDKLTEYGIKREILGRLPIIVELNKLTKEIFKEIILESDESEMISHIKFLNSLGIELTNLDEIVDLIIEDAMKRNIGARGLIPTINNIFIEIIYEVANDPDKYSKVIIGPNILNDRYDFKLIEKDIKKRIKA